MQTIWTLGISLPGFILFASMKKYSLMCNCTYAADVKSRQHFDNKQKNNCGRIRVNIMTITVYFKHTVNGSLTFELIHNTKEQIYFYEIAGNHKAKEQLFESISEFSR